MQKTNKIFDNRFSTELAVSKAVQATLKAVSDMDKKPSDFTEAEKDSVIKSVRKAVYG